MKREFIEDLQDGVMSLVITYKPKKRKIIIAHTDGHDIEKTKISVDRWVEILNVDALECEATLTWFDGAGQTVALQHGGASIHTLDNMQSIEFTHDQWVSLKKQIADMIGGQ